jgi:prevent-host-death family protein
MVGYMNKIVPISDLQTKAKQCVDQVKDSDEVVIITQRGRAAAVLVSIEHYEGLVATHDEMSYPDWQERLRRAQRESRARRGVSLDSYVRRRSKR